MGVVLPQSGRGFPNFARASRAILYYNPPFRNRGSATDVIINLASSPLPQILSVSLRLAHTVKCVQ